MVDGVERNTSWGSSPLYEEVTAAPLLVSLPDVAPGTYGGLTSAIDLAPTVLDLMGQEIPAAMEGRSLLPALRDSSVPGNRRPTPPAVGRVHARHGRPRTPAETAPRVALMRLPPAAAAADALLDCAG